MSITIKSNSSGFWGRVGSLIRTTFERSINGDLVGWLGKWLTPKGVGLARGIANTVGYLFPRTVERRDGSLTWFGRLCRALNSAPKLRGPASEGSVAVIGGVAASAYNTQELRAISEGVVGAYPSRTNTEVLRELVMRRHAQIAAGS